MAAMDLYNDNILHPQNGRNCRVVLVVGVRAYVDTAVSRRDTRCGCGIGGVSFDAIGG